MARSFSKFLFPKPSQIHFTHTDREERYTDRCLGMRASLGARMVKWLLTIQGCCPLSRNECFPWCSSVSAPCSPDCWPLWTLDVAVDDCSGTHGVPSSPHRSSWCLLPALLVGAWWLQHLQGPSFLIPSLLTAIFGQGPLSWR